MTAIKTLKDGRVFGATITDDANIRYSLGDAADLTGSAPFKLSAKQGDLTHCVILWGAQETIGLTADEEITLAQIIRQADVQMAAARAQYAANPNKYRRFESAADRRDRAYAAQYDSQEG